MRISSISQFGKVTVSFSEPFIVPSNATEIVNATTLGIELIPTNYPTLPMLNFVWELLSFTTTYIEI